MADSPRTGSGPHLDRGTQRQIEIVPAVGDDRRREVDELPKIIARRRAVKRAKDDLRARRPHA